MELKAGKTLLVVKGRGGEWEGGLIDVDRREVHGHGVW